GTGAANCDEHQCGQGIAGGCMGRTDSPGDRRYQAPPGRQHAIGDLGSEGGSQRPGTVDGGRPLLPRLDRGRVGQERLGRAEREGVMIMNASRYNTTCRNCGKAIHRGDLCSGGKGRSFCAACSGGSANRPAGSDRPSGDPGKVETTTYTGKMHARTSYDG